MYEQRPPTPNRERLLFEERALLVQALCLLAHDAKYPVWIHRFTTGEDAGSRPRWPTLNILLPNGQVSFLIPDDKLILREDEVPHELYEWDGSGTAERLFRLREFITLEPFNMDEDEPILEEVQETA